MADPATNLNPSDITRLLHEIELQTPGAVDQLVGLVYSDLRKMASYRMRSMPSCDTLQPTAMVNELFLRLFGSRTPSWPDRRHFFHAAGRAIRDILVERARKAMSQKRGGGHQRVQLDEAALLWQESESLLQLTEALSIFEGLHARQCEVVEMKYFVGLNEEEIAQVLGISEITVRRDWKFARAWLFNCLAESPAAEA